MCFDNNIAVETKSETVKPITVPIGAPEIPNSLFCKRICPTTIFTEQPISMDKSGTFTLPRASSKEFTISRSDIIAAPGTSKHRSGAPRDISALGNSSVRISFEKLKPPKTNGAEINADRISEAEILPVSLSLSLLDTQREKSGR